MNTDEYFAMGFAKTAQLKGYNAAELAKRREALNRSLNNLKEFSEWADRQPSAKITGTPDAIAAAAKSKASNTNMVNMVNRTPPRTPYLKTMQIKGMRSQMTPSPRTGVPTSSWDETFKKMKEFDEWMRKQPAANIMPVKHNF